MMMKPQVLVMAGDDAADAIIAAGFDLAGEDTAPRQTAAVILDARGDNRTRAINLRNSLAAALGPRAGLFFAWTDPGTDHMLPGFDGAFPADTPPPFIAARLGSALRIAVMADEAKLRFDTLSRFGGAARPPQHMRADALRVLVYGLPGPHQLAVSSILDALDIDTVAAMTSFTAFDYLHEGGFDAVLMVANDDQAGAKAFASAMRRNTRLFHLPLLVMASADFGEIEPVFERGASDVVFAGHDDEAAVVRLLTLADEKRRREALSLAFAAARTARAMDNGTGLYSRDFFISHLDTLIRRVGETDSILSLALVEVSQHNVPDVLKLPGALDRVIGQAGAMLGRLVRAEDVAARLDRGLFAIALPASDEAAAMIAAERIAAVLECTGFNPGSDDGAVTITMNLATASCLPGESAEALIGRTARNLARLLP
jgi:two-component system, cell cycle response regulator PopA